MSQLRDLPLPLLAAAVFLSACGSSPTSNTDCADDGGCEVSLAIQVEIGGFPVDQVVVEVTGPGISDPLVFNLTLSENSASGTITVPAGSERTITVTAFDAGGVATHRGSVTISIEEGENPSVSITLDALQGDQPIEAHVGSVTVIVEPTSATLQVDETLRLEATVRDANDEILDVQVRWATLNPAVAWVDIEGLVTAINVGEVGIVATYGGVAAKAELTVEPRPLTWETLPAIPTPVSAPGAASYESRIYVLSGGIFGEHVDANQIFDTTSGEWSTGAPVPIATGFASAVTLNGKIHLLGGSQEPSGHRVYDPELDSWSQAASLPESRWAGEAQVVGGLIYFIGGRTPSNDQTGTVQIYDPSSDSWSFGTDMPTARQNGESAVIDGLIYVAGGEEAGLVESDALEVYDPASDTWTALSPVPAALDGLGGGTVAGELCVFGGRLVEGTPTGNAFPETYCYDPKTDVWEQGPDMITARVNMGETTLEDAIYAIGGRSGDGASDANERLSR